MILLDTSVLVYAVGADHALRDPCRAIVRAIGEGRIFATTTVEVIQEFAHARARRRGRGDAADLAGRFAGLLAPLVTLDADDLARGLELFRRTEELGAFDSVLAAAALRRDHVHALVSANRAFSAVPGLDHIDPADPPGLPRLGVG